jgi:hypothetical protein
MSTGSWLGLRLLVLALAAAYTLEITMVEAQDTRSEAQAAFEAGRTLMNAGDYAAACERFEASLRLEASTGTLLNLAVCYERAQKLASAMRSFRDGAARAAAEGDDKRAARARERAEALAARLSTIVVRPMAQVPEGLVISLDEAVLDASALGQPQPLDGGQHRVHAEAPGREPSTTAINIASEGEHAELALPELALVAPAPLAQIAEPSPVLQKLIPKAQPVRSDQPVRSEAWSRSRIAGVSVAAAGVAGVALGIGFGVRAKHTWSDRLDVCKADEPCPKEGRDLTRDAHKAALISDVSFAVGGTALVGGALLYWLAPRTRSGKTTASLDVSRGRLQAGLTLRF